MGGLMIKPLNKMDLLKLFGNMATHNGYFLPYCKFMRKDMFLSRFKTLYGIFSQYPFVTIYINQQQQIKFLLTKYELYDILRKSSNNQKYVVEIEYIDLPVEQYDMLVMCLKTPIQTLIASYFAQSIELYYTPLNTLPTH